MTQIIVKLVQVVGYGKKIQMGRFGVNQIILNVDSLLEKVYSAEELEKQTFVRLVLL